MTDTIAGWASYKFHNTPQQPARIKPGQIIDYVGEETRPMFIRTDPALFYDKDFIAALPVSRGINRQFFQYGESSKPTEPQCSGCGARKTIQVNSRAVCAYCKGDK